MQVQYRGWRLVDHKVWVLGLDYVRVEVRPQSGNSCFLSAAGIGLETGLVYHDEHRNRDNSEVFENPDVMGEYLDKAFSMVRERVGLISQTIHRLGK